MHGMLHLAADIARNTILITGLVISMMMMIEVINVRTRGRFLSRMQGSGFRQVLLSSVLGIIPGCMGGFAAVSLYTHRMLSFGALTAMMIASSGDEAFVMLAMFPGKALMLMGILFVVAIISGVIVDFFSSRGRSKDTTEGCRTGYTVHEEHLESHDAAGKARTFGWKRAVLSAGLLLFALALASGHLSHSHGGEEHVHGALSLLDEGWMNVLFGLLCLFLLWIIARGSDYLVDSHLWNHIIKKHFLSVFLWTAGVLTAVQAGMMFFDIAGWLSGNTALLILMAALIGIIPESGPHLIFVTLFATGSIPMSVLAASSISQDGHASIPLLAEDKKAFVKTKALNVAIALAVGYGMYFIETL